MKPRGLPHSEIPGYARSRLTEAYRSVATSFIGSRRPGIHPARILVCGARDAGFGLRPVEGAGGSSGRRRPPGGARSR